MIKPKIWGPPLWYYLHTKTFKYPENPTNEEQDEIIDFFKYKVQKLIPCKECVDNYNKKLQYYPVELSSGSRYELTRWLIGIHNQVNLATGKPMMPVEDAISLYENRNYLNKVILLIIIILIFMVLYLRS